MSNYDVVVLGSGIAGLSAALAAHEAGLKPLLLEKSDLLGGGTTNSYGLIWVGENHFQLQSGMKDNRDDIVNYMRFLGGGELNEERMTTFVDQSPAVLKRFADWGIPFRLVRGVTDHYFGMAPGAVAEGRTLEAELISGFDLGEWKDRIVIPDDVPCYVTAEEQVLWGGMNRFSQWDQDVVRERKARDMRGKGVGLVCHFVKALNDRNIAILTGQKIHSLLFDGHRVTGVRMEGGKTIPAAKGVVLATGGYDWNVEFARELEGLPDLVPMGPESLTGDGLVLGAEVGAIIHRIQNSLFLMLGYTVPSIEPGKPPVSCRASIVELFCPHTMIVNRAGKRFADESFFQDIVPTLRQFDTLKHEHPTFPATSFLISSICNSFPLGTGPLGALCPRQFHGRTICLISRRSSASVSEAFLTTIERFNDFARSGIDQDFHRGELKWKLASTKGRTVARTQRLARSRFAVLWCRIASQHCQFGGLVANSAAQVMHHRKLRSLGSMPAASLLCEMKAARVSGRPYARCGHDL